MQTTRSHRLDRARIAAVASVPAVLLGLAVFAALAFASFHTTNNTLHGLGSSTGGGLGAGKPYSKSETGIWQVHHEAAVYHANDNGTLNQQCHSGAQRINAVCVGTSWGTAPCQKRAYAQSYVIGAGQQMPWHWMRGATCAGSTHQ